MLPTAPTLQEDEGGKAEVEAPKAGKAGAEVGKATTSKRPPLSLAMSATTTRATSVTRRTAPVSMRK